MTSSNFLETQVHVRSLSETAGKLALSITSIAKQVEHSNIIASTATQDAQNAKNIIKDLKDTSQKINVIINLISDIASQTNLLALNATIEASRSGEFGKGFSVVASEVKNLANETVAATAQITSQISTIRNEVNETSTVIDKMNETISHMNEISVLVSESIQEQSINTTQMHKTVLEMVTKLENTLKTVDDSEQICNIAQSGLDNAEDLFNQIDILKSTLQNSIAKT